MKTGIAKMITKVADKVWKFTGTDKVNIYFLDFEEKMIIDAGNRVDRHLVIQFLGKVVDFDKVTKVIFTHLHYDHVGNYDLFPNAEFYASRDAIADFLNNKFESMLDEDMVQRFDKHLQPLPKTLCGLEIISTPGHTKGAVCIWYPEERILFSGDTLFKNKNTGRTDLPTSIPSELNNSLVRLVDYNYKILCPGHDY